MSNCYICGCVGKNFSNGFCQYHYRQDYYLKNVEKERLRSRKYFENHRKECNERRRKYNLENRKEQTEHRREYRKTKNGRIATLRAIRKYEKNHPERKKAWGKAHFITMESCTICGKLPTHRHHPDIEQPLEVIFLCALHHKQAHRQVV